MIHIRKWALALCLALLCSSYSNSQTIDYTTGNLINTGTSATDTTSTWNNGVYVNQLCFQAGQAGNCGPNPSIRAASGSINFSYGTADLNQVVNINRALAAAGTGVQLSGFNFGFTAKNGNGWDDGRQDYLSAYVKLYGSAGDTLANYDYSSQTNRKYNWTNFNFSETFASPQLASLYSNAKVGFIGRDNNYWAGNYGPEIMDVSFSLKYKVDPCSQNPAYSSTCAGFNNLVTSSNISAQSYGINQALANAGSAIQISGLNYGYALYVGGDWCSQSFLGIFCTRTEPSAMSVNATVTSNTGATLYSQTNNYTQQDTFGNYSYKYIFPTQRTPDSMGNFSLTASQYGTGAMYSNWSNWIYTPDPCVNDPLSSPSCKGYAVAYAKNMLLGSTVASASAPATYSTGINNTSNGAPAAAQPTSNGTPDPTNPAPQGQPSQGQPAPAPQGQQPAQNSQGQPQDPSQPPPQQAQPSQGQQQQPPGSPPQTAPGSVAAPGSPPPPAGAPQQPGAPSNQAGPAGGTATAKTGPSMNMIMSVIGSIQAADKATQNAAVQNAQQVVSTSSAAAQAQAFQVVDQLNTMSSASSQASQQQANTGSPVMGPSVSQSASSALAIKGPTTLSVQTLSAIAVQSSSSQVQSQQISSQNSFSINSSAYSLTANTTNKPALGLSVNMQSANAMSLIQQPQIMMPQMSTQISSFNRSDNEVPAMPVTSGYNNRGNPLAEMMEARTMLSTMQNDQQTDTVKRNVQPNELAGGVDIAAMAVAPKGYDAYSIVTLRDVAFYKPESIYKNQNTVDNVRALRQMSSDSLHKQMIDSQYKEK